MYSYEESLPISVLRQYCFCPRIPFFILIYGLSPAERPWMKQGTNFHEEMSILQKRRNLSAMSFKSGKFLSNIGVKSERLGIHGKLDGLFRSDSGEIFPIEFKSTSCLEVRRSHVVQLAAYAMALEENYQTKIKKGFLILGKRGKVAEVLIDDQKRNKVEELVKKLKTMLDRGAFPDSSATEAQCCQCEYLNFCADRF